MAGLIAASALDRVSFAKKIPMLKKYTSDDDNPTPGYIFQDINQITYETITSCNSLLDFLINRLKKRSPCVKYKVLKILCYLANNGHSEFRSGLRHKAAVIREAESFTGEMDYLRGDSLNQRVRATASELIGLLFNVESSETTSMHSMIGPSGKKMEGFGNSHSQPAKNKTWLDSLMTFAEHLPNAANVLKPKNNNMEVSTVSGRSAIAFVNYTDSANATSDFGKFLDSDDYVQLHEEGESENMVSVEAHLVDEITCEGGIRNVPSKESLNQFTKRCSSLNLSKVLEALNQRMLEPVTEVQLKSLYVLEHLLKNDFRDVGSKVSHHCTNLHEIAQTESGNVSSRARKILSIVKVTEEKERMEEDSMKNVNDSSMQSEKSRVENGQDLLGLENEKGATNLKRIKSQLTAQGVGQHIDGFKGIKLGSGKYPPENVNPLMKSEKSSRSDLDDLFCLTSTSGSTSSVEGQRKLDADQRVTDLFDPLCNAAATSSDSVISPAPANLLSVNTSRPTFSGLAGLMHGPLHSSGDSHSLLCSEPLVTNSRNGIALTNPAAGNLTKISQPTAQASSLSAGSTVSSRRPQLTQKTDFSFVGKSRGSDAFSFVQDEIKARK
ncbi:AP-4 complex accessory subunit tepsin-like isoform X2 [Acropora millepora]|uniref:AP-4 complex accessory subunit tepsin-like isoform X2 n=1 Tax=Acropora millepora TaxID=45264 RepID=UPI001CF37515|nr:AP-4 complex accessory subunit tepsin-like isoform X2 [Acropora millepora]